jgi:uncharacterized protein (TIGR02246 family)
MKYLATILAFTLAASALIAEEPQPSADQTAIRKVLDDQVLAWNKGDLLEFMEGYWKSKDLTFYSGKDKHLGWDKALERYQKRYQSEGKEMGQLSFAELEIQVLSPEFAVVKGRFSVELKQENLGGLFTLLMKKIDGKWLIVHDHTSA